MKKLIVIMLILVFLFNTNVAYCEGIIQNSSDNEPHVFGIQDLTISNVGYNDEIATVGVLKEDRGKYLLFTSPLSYRDDRVNEAIVLEGLSSSENFSISDLSKLEGNYVKVTGWTKRIVEQMEGSDNEYTRIFYDISAIALVDFPTEDTEQVEVSWESDSQINYVWNLETAILARNPAVHRKAVEVSGNLIWEDGHCVLYPFFEDYVFHVKENGILVEDMLAVAIGVYPLTEEEKMQSEEKLITKISSFCGYVDLGYKGENDEYAATLRLHNTISEMEQTETVASSKQTDEISIYQLLADPWAYDGKEVVVQGYFGSRAGIYGKDYVWFTIKSMNYLRGIQVLVDDMDKGKGRVDEGGPVKTAIDLNRQFYIALTLNGVFHFDENKSDKMYMDNIEEWYLHPMRLQMEWR